MKIGIIGSRTDRQNKEYLDLSECISKTGNYTRMIYSDALDVKLKQGAIDICQTSEKPSGAGVDMETIDIDCGVLRHLGIVKDYEQFMFRVWCMRAFEETGRYLMNPAFNWLAATDKFGTLLELAKHGIPIPETDVSEQMFVAYKSVRRFKSAVVKPLRSVMGFGVFKIDDPDVGMHIFSYFTNANKPMYVQKYLQKKRGGDYRIIVVGGEVIGGIFRKSKGWKSNIAQGGIPKAVKPDSELKELAVKSAEALGLEFAGVDIAETKDGYSVLELNPAMTWQGFKKATGINPAKSIISHLIEQVKR